MSYDDDHMTTILAELAANPEDFNDWEMSFIDSVTAQHENGRVLSDKQVNVINRLYNRIPKDEVE